MKLRTLLQTNVDRTLAIGLIVIGAVALILGWLGVSGKALAPEQIPYLISGGLGGVLLGAVGCTLWLSADLQDEWRRLDGIEDKLADLVETQARAADAVTVSSRQNGRARTGRVVSKSST